MRPAVAAGAPATDAAAVRATLRAERERAIQAFLRDQDPRRLQRALARAADAALRTLWAAHAMPAGSALLAVGGYGRRDQFPFSDVDILVLLPDAPPDEAAGFGPAIEAFIGACWDGGLELGHSVRTVDACLEEAQADVTVRTALLERRVLVGSRRLCLELDARFAAALDPRAFFRAKLLEMRQRHQKNQDTPYSLEPNCKESPGGLRDLQVVLWVARAAGLGDGWRDLARQGLVTPAEASQASRNARQLALIRAHLHILARRREDRLVFDLQAPLARALDIREDSARRASERLMQRYYWAAKAVTQLSAILLPNIEARLFPQPDARPEPLEGGFSNRLGLLDMDADDLFERDPAAILRAFLVMQRHPELHGMTARTLRAIWRARRLIDGRFRREPAHRELFLRILQEPRGIVHALRRMNQLSVLGRYLPAFRRIVGQMQHDLFHVYTVDQHILTVLRNLRRFTMPAHAHEYPLCTELMSEFGRPWLLYIAALFHDIAKGRGGDHSELGKHDARRFCRDHAMPEADTELVVFLVEQHLTMSTVAQKRDLSDPAVIEDFARRVGTRERLVALYLLTVADIRGTSPKVWNAWKGKLLEDLFRAAARALTGERSNAGGLVDETRREARRLLNLIGLDPEAYRHLWAQLDLSYFLRHDATDVAWHTRTLFRHADATRPIVRTRIAPFGGGFQVSVYAPDEPDLFARICGYFDGKNLSVLDARIHTTRQGHALDTFLVEEPGFTGNYRDVLNLVEVELAKRLAERAPLGPPVRGRPSRRSRSFPITPTVELVPDERAQVWVLSVAANDRTGLLYAIACVLARHKLNLRSARIATLGERVEDSFVVDGAALANERSQLRLETELLEAMQP